jgi:hypothetical protein
MVTGGWARPELGEDVDRDETLIRVSNYVEFICFEVS